jgi:hypothetical protein
MHREKKAILMSGDGFDKDVKRPDYSGLESS